MTIEELIDMLVTERMSAHYKEFRKDDSNTQSEISLKAARIKYESLILTMPEEHVEVISSFVDGMLQLLASDNERFYRVGVADGINVDNLISRLKNK